MEPIEELRQLAQFGDRQHRAGVNAVGGAGFSFVDAGLWGRIRNQVHAQEYAAQVSAADLELEKLTQQASLAQFFFEIRGQDMLQQLLNQTVEAVPESARCRAGRV